MASNLDAIRIKIRRLTRSLSSSQLPDSTINEYINTFVLYDLPEHLRLLNLKETFSFYSEPFIDVYDTKTAPSTSPLYNFKNKYLTVHQPVFVAGYGARFYESRSEFYNNYPYTNNVQTLAQKGDGANVTFPGTLPINQGTVSTVGKVTILKNNVLFNSVDTSGNSLVLIDVPTTPLVGALIIPNDTANTYGSINYTTGQFTVNFPTAPAANENVNVQYVVLQPSRPQSILFYDGKFTLRPIPDQAYKITLDVFVRPAELLDSSPEPKLEEWWQLIAYGAARKVFQDRMDMESLQMIEPEYQNQMLLVQRRTIVQQTSQRTPTIYANDYWGPNDWWFNNLN